MANAKRDENRISTLLGVSNVDGITPVVLWADPITHRLLVDLSSATGLVPYVGATEDVDLGMQRLITTGNLISGELWTTSNISNGGAYLFTTFVDNDTPPTLISSLASVSTGVFDFQGSKKGSLDFSGLTSDQSFDLPDASGTIALTSDLSGKLSLDQTTPETIANGKPIISEGIQFGTSPTVGTFAEGKLYYDANFKTFAAEIDSDVTLQIGQETMAYCYNGTASPITGGKVVYVVTAANGVPSIALAKADSETTSYALGIVTTSTIAVGGYGMVSIRGHVNSIDTTGTPVSETWNVGDILYLSSATAGALTNVQPSAGSNDVRIGRVMIVDATTGRIFVNLTPRYRLTDLSDVTISSPTTDQILRYNGIEWVNGAEGAVSASAGVSFYYDGTDIIPTGNDNSNKVETLSKTPSTAVEDVETTTVNNNTILSDIYLYDTALGRTSIDSGVWNFESYAAVSSATSVSEILHNVMRVRTGAGTVTITDGASATEKIVTASTGTPFASDMVDVGGTIDTDSFLRTPKGVYRITVRTDDTHIKILVPSTYTNESTVAFSVHKRLFQSTTGEINNTATSPLFAGLQLYSINSVQPAYTILVTDKIAIYRFSKTTRTSNTYIYFAYGGTTRYSHLTSPLITLHNNLAGLQGGTGSGVTGEFYHLTSDQATVVGNTSGTNSGDNAANSSCLAITGGTLTGALLFTDNTYDIGAAGATRPRTGYFGTSIISPLALIGATANSTDWPTAKVVGSQADSAHSYTGNIGIVGESVASSSDTGTGVGGVSVTNGANESRGVTGVGKVGATGDTAKANGVYGYVNGTHAGGDNIGVRGSAINGANNYAFYGENGKIYSSGDIELGHLTDTTIHRVSAGIVSIEGNNIMTVASADTITGVKTLGTTAAIKLGSAVTDKCEIRLNDAALNDETWSGTVLDCVAGATLAVGDVCYLKTADGQWYLNDGILDGTDTGFKLKLGICVLAANDNGATKMLLDGLIASAAFPTFTVGAPVYLDDTAGDLVVAQPTTTNFAIRVVGEAVSATILHFHPSNDYIVHV